MKTELIIATRESPLALWQANWVKDRLNQFYPHMAVRLLGLTTKADKMLETPLYNVGGKGLFVKELEEALLEKRADIAVHSMKDVPMNFLPGLCLSTMCEREDPRDVIVSSKAIPFKSLPPDSVIGTSSLRRQSQLFNLRSDIIVKALRGNVNTRLAKLEKGEFSAIILAAAGLKRLELTEKITDYFSIDDMLPAPGQGVLGIECREEDDEVHDLLKVLQHPETYDCVIAERAMCRALDSSCQMPVAAFAEMVDGQILLKGLVGSENGQMILQVNDAAPREKAESLGISVANALLAQGAKGILNL